MHKYILQVSADIIEGYVAFHEHKLFCIISAIVYTEYLKILNNILRSSVTFKTKDYPIFLFEDILQKLKNIYKVIQYINFEDLQINIGNENFPTLFFDILY